MRGIPVVATSVAVAALVTVSGCGHSGSTPAKAAGPAEQARTPAAAPDNGSALVAAAYTTLANTKTARMDLTAQLTAGGTSGASGADVRSTGTAVLNFTTKQLDLVVHTPTGQQVEERLVDKVAYTKLPAPVVASEPQLKGKPWVRYDLRNATPSLSFGGDGAAADPTQVLQFLTSASDKVERAGTEQVRGTETTHYVATVDLAKLGAKQGASPQEVTAIQKLLGTNTFPVDVWVDGQGLTHRVQFHLPLPKAQTGTSTGSETITEEFYDFGTPVTVQAPPASQVTDERTLARAERGTSSSGGSSSSSSGSSSSGTTHA